MTDYSDCMEGLPYIIKNNGSGTDTTLNATDESLSIISDGAGNWYIF